MPERPAPKGCLLRLVVLAALLWSPAHCEQRTRVLKADSFCASPDLELQGLEQADFVEYSRLSVQENGRSAALLQRILEQPLLLSDEMLERGVSNLGSCSRVERAMHKLVAGEQVTIVALGGSVSAGHGVRDPDNSWISRVFSWVKDTFPHRKHMLLNHAIPAVTSGYASACVPELVPDDTDLVILEWTYNDNVFSGGNRSVNDPSRRGLERLLRRLVSHPNQPGIIYLHYWPAARYPAFWSNGENHINEVLQYYGIPTLSMRNALHQFLTDNPEMVDQLWFPPPDRKIHPTCIGARAMADLVIGRLQSTAAAVLGQPNDPKAVEVSNQPFLLSGNWGHRQTACYLEQEFKSLVKDVKGWSWLDEGRSPEQHKWGYISHTKGSILGIKVPLDTVSADSKHFLVGLGGLISYEHMGSMDIRCWGGCSCPRVQHSMLHTQNFSMTGWRYIQVTRTDKAEECTVTVSNAELAVGGSEHKVKLSSLMISTKGEVVEGEEALSMVDLAMQNLGSAQILEDDDIDEGTEYEAEVEEIGRDGAADDREDAEPSGEGAEAEVMRRAGGAAAGVRPQPVGKWGEWAAEWSKPEKQVQESFRLSNKESAGRAASRRGSRKDRFWVAPGKRPIPRPRRRHA